MSSKFLDILTLPDALFTFVFISSIRTWEKLQFLHFFSIFWAPVAISSNRANCQQKSKLRLPSPRLPAKSPKSPNQSGGRWIALELSGHSAALLTSPIDRRSWRKRSREKIVKKLSKIPKSPIIWLLAMSGRAYQVMSRFCPGVPDISRIGMLVSKKTVFFRLSF